MTDLGGLEPVHVPRGTPGLYFSLLPTGEVKIGVAECITRRHTALELRGARILAICPGGMGAEADLHARFRPHRSREEGDVLCRETYFAVPELVALIDEIRARGFTPADLRRQAWKGATTVLRFDDGQALTLILTYLPLTEPGELTPRYLLERECPSCGEDRNSLDFLTEYTIESLGRRAKRDYLVLQSADRCSSCSARVMPAAIAFPGGKTSIRLGRLIARDGSVVQAYDRDNGEWTELRDFGIRRMAKRPRDKQPNDLTSLRLQPSIGRNGVAQGKR